MSKETTIKLISFTANPIETIYAEWLQSRTTVFTPDAGQLRRMANDGCHMAGDPKPLKEQMEDVFEKVVAMKMPLAETLDFIFLIENCPVALREQMVRHRIGHSFGEKLGADIVPDLAGKSSFWSQTVRIIDMGMFAVNGDYFTPTFHQTNQEGHISYNMLVGENRMMNADEYYQHCMSAIQDMYNILKNTYKWPLEDARNVLPMAMTHRLTWKINFSSLMHIMSKRSCWLAQLGMWEPVIKGMISELRDKVHPAFGRLADPPCIGSDGNFDKCAFGQENIEMVGKGEYPPCSLWINNDYINSQHLVEGSYEQSLIEKGVVGTDRMPRYQRMKDKYTQLWHRDPVTGDRLQLS